MNKHNRTLIPLILLFIILNAIILIGKTFLQKNGFNTEFLMYANLLLFVISIGGFLIQRKSLQSPNPNAFVRGMYASLMFKMFICMFAVLVYVFILRTKINKPGLFAAMGMYIIYTAIEVIALTKVVRKKPNA